MGKSILFLEVGDVSAMQTHQKMMGHLLNEFLTDCAKSKMISEDNEVVDVERVMEVQNYILPMLQEIVRTLWGNVFDVSELEPDDFESQYGLEEKLINNAITTLVKVDEMFSNEYEDDIH